MHEVFSNSQNDTSASAGNRPAPNQRPSALFCAESGDTMVNRGASGAMTQDQSFVGHNLPARAAGTSVWFLELLTNDMYFRPKTAVGKQWSRDFLAACISHALFGVKKTARSGADATTGAWSNTPVDTLGMQTVGAGASKKFTVSGPIISVCWLADHHTASQGVFEIRIDGALVDTVNTFVPFGNTQNGLRYGHAARLYPVTAGQHIVEVKCVSNGTAAYLSYVAGSGDQASFPKCFVGTGSQIATVPTAYSAECRQMVLDLCASLFDKGLPVKAVDTWSVINPASHMMPDGVHWNAPGAAAVCSAMQTAAAEPKTLHFPLASGGVLSVNLDENGVCTSYSEEP